MAFEESSSVLQTGEQFEVTVGKLVGSDFGDDGGVLPRVPERRLRAVEVGVGGATRQDSLVADDVESAHCPGFARPREKGH